MKLAVIDLGTNTCNLLIAELQNGNFTILHQSKQLVKLGDNKIKNNEISPEATARTVQSFSAHKGIIQKFGVKKVLALATSAVRTAENKISFLDEISEKSGWVVKVVSGEKEAELIFEGVLLAFGDLEKPTAILDIGGGSNEIIVARNREMLWKESQPTGMARVINRFDLSDPVLPKEVEMLRQFFSENHQEAFEQCRKLSVKHLVGCSGAFDTIADMIDKVDPGKKPRRTQNIELNDFYCVYHRLLASTRNERLTMKGMDMVRVDLIVPAVILIEQFIAGAGIDKITQTDYALREGVLFELLKIGKQFT